ncbi:hypothetical protein AC579_7348 [Pseudocercospora musae]|uniref:Uncharacterized protein n=1 Tax=Pseudocercospora musae TaxID=113226 RepID=A0A139ICQ6_9PEZI|nr:hypothetical protein AC579_7348 [Pseudocercospora musae]
MAATNQASNVAAEVALTEGINRLNLGPGVDVAPEQAAKRSTKNKKKTKKKKKKAGITPQRSREAEEKTKQELAKNCAAEQEAEIENVLKFFDERYHSNPDKLVAYQTFCEDLGVEVGPSLTKCRKILSQVFVNIWDFVIAKQAETMVHRFATANKLRKYSKATGKFFPLKRAKEDTVLHELLIYMNPRYLR